MPRTGAGHTTRREALAAAGAAVLAAGTFPQTSVAARARRAPTLAAAGGFPSGVVAGHPAQHSISLWTRLGDQERTRGLQLEIARDADFRNVVLRRVVPASRWRDHTVHERVSSRRVLAPDEQYFYRFATRTTSSPVGRFKTLAPPDSRRPVRIAWFSCQRYEHGYFTAQQAIAAEPDLDLVVSLGDYLYEETGAGKIPERNGAKAIGEPNNTVETLDQWRALWRLYRSDERLQAMHAAHPFLAVWDDCEVEGNWAGQGPSSGPTPVDGRSVPFAVKRRNGFNAFFENMPMQPFAGERTRIYRQLRLGGVADLFMLDTRQYRDGQPCGDATLTPCPEAESMPRKRLGDNQLAWLKRSVTGSRATWKILGNPQMLMALDLPTTVPVGVDGWDGYGRERTELMQHLRANDVSGVVSLVGDVHFFCAGQVTTDGRITGRPAAAEFVGTSVSHDALQLPGLDRNLSDTVANQIVLANPHLSFAEFAHRGYAVATLTPEEAIVEFKGVRSVLTPTSEAFTVAKFRLGAGETRPTRIA